MPRSKRPAEKSAGAAGVIATAIVLVFNVEDAKLAALLPALVGFVPGGVTWLIERWRRG